MIRNETLGRFRVLCIEIAKKKKTYLARGRGWNIDPAHPTDTVPKPNLQSIERGLVRGKERRTSLTEV